MAGPAVEIAKRYVEALAADDFEAAYALLDPDVVSVSARGTKRGADTLRRGWDKDGYEHLVPEVAGREYVQQNGVVRATTHLTWRWTETDEIAYRTRVDGDFTIRDGKILRIELAVEHEASE